MVTQKDTNVYLEAMEETGNEGKESDQARNGTVEGIQKRKHSKRLLGCSGQWYITTYHNKRKTCTQGIF